MVHLPGRDLTAGFVRCDRGGKSLLCIATVVNETLRTGRRRTDQKFFDQADYSFVYTLSLKEYNYYI